MGRQLSIRVGDSIYDIEVAPRQTSAQVLRDLQLPQEYQLSGPDGRLRADTETLRDLSDGDELFATAPSVVG